MKKLLGSINKIYKRKNLTNIKKYIKLLHQVNNTLSHEDISIRPRDTNGYCGGVVKLKNNIKTIIVSDLHARVDFIKNLLDFKIDEVTVLEQLLLDNIQIVCVGDGFHSEGRAKERWLLASEEFTNGFQNHKNMSEEMIENFNLMELIFLLKVTFPENFHFLKGNHENILNENVEGNVPFGKFAKEGLMVKTYIQKFYPKELIHELYVFEKKLPILAVGDNFLISHSEPKHFYPLEQVINYYSNTRIIYDLTWTNNGDSKEHTVEKMLKHYLPSNFNASLYFSGHRPVNGFYNLRANNRFVQFHNPQKQMIAVLTPMEPINLDTDIIDIKEQKEF